MHPCYCVSIIPERPRCSFFIAGWYTGIKFMDSKEMRGQFREATRGPSRHRVEPLPARMAGSKI